jgi:hypothetical protein
MAQWPSGGNNGVDSHMSSATWVHFEEFEDILTALPVLRGRVRESFLYSCPSDSISHSRRLGDRLPTMSY